MPVDTPIDLQKALQNPETVFGTPSAVLASELPRADKLAVLRRWESDVRELSVATDENMAGSGADEEGSMLAQVRLALQKVEDEAAGDEPAAPTKHGG